MTRIRTSLTRVLLAAALFAASGCYKATFHQDTAAVRGAEHDEWQDYFVFGLAGSNDIDVRQYCGGTEPAEVQSGGNFATGLVSLVTIGIYTPRKVYVTCPAAQGGTP